ncbi:MAG: LON peptidase substrate-binding domain-containing protein [Acidimicrobiia bacterium]|nr:LON peptidase substrate-binding domain-containing protein [Acidimicrobiia bacterium]
MTDTPYRLPMFPLGSVLFPTAVLPLQVFEPRYLQMLAELVDDPDGRFGVVLIERGWEVGGGDERFDVATAARVLRVAKIDEHRLAVVAVGEERVRVVEWLPDDPYPVAMVEPIDDGELEADVDQVLDQARSAFRRTLALASELGYDVGNVESEMPDDPLAASWFLSAVSPLEEIDRQRLLETTGIASRLRVVTELLGDRAFMLEARLGGA